MVAFIVCCFHFTGSFYWSSSFLYRVQPHKRSGWLVSTAKDTRQWRGKPCTHQVDFHLRHKMFFRKVGASLLLLESPTSNQRHSPKDSSGGHHSFSIVLSLLSLTSPARRGKREVSPEERGKRIIGIKQVRTSTPNNWLVLERSLHSLIRCSSDAPVKGPFSFKFDMLVNKLTKSLYKTDACSCTTVLWSLAT